MTKKRSQKRIANSPPDDHILAEIPEAPPESGKGTEAEGTFEVVPPPPEGSSVPARASDRSATPAPAATPEPIPPPSQPAEDRPLLPRGGIITMRRSGGFRFTSVTVTVFRDGRVTVEDRATPAMADQRPARKLGDAELAELYRTLESADLPELPAVTGHQNPDAYSYEIAARVGGKTYFTVAFDGSIPPQLAPLIKLLAGYTSPSSPTPDS